MKTDHRFFFFCVFNLIVNFKFIFYTKSEKKFNNNDLIERYDVMNDEPVLKKNNQYLRVLVRFQNLCSSHKNLKSKAKKKNC